MNGKGIYHYASGENYTGEFVDGQRHGKGVHTWFDGKRYEGQFKNDAMDGRGKMYRGNTVVKEGIWLNDRCISWVQFRLAVFFYTFCAISSSVKYRLCCTWWLVHYSNKLDHQSRRSSAESRWVMFILSASVVSLRWFHRSFTDYSDRFFINQYIWFHQIAWV